jgi:hypothetical protein
MTASTLIPAEQLPDERASAYASLWRAMTGDEADRLEHGDKVALMNVQEGTVVTGTMYSATDAAINIKTRAGAIISLDIDNPDYWDFDETAEGSSPRERRAPQSDEGEWVAIVTGQTDNTDLTVAIRASIEIGKLHRRADALLADVVTMQNQMRALSLRKAS